MRIIKAGGKCDNNCFANQCGCNVHTNPECEELTVDQVNNRLLFDIYSVEKVFLYTPDMFSEYYYPLYQKLRLFGADEKPAIPPYISINASVRNFIDRNIEMRDLLEKGIKEVWLGVESGSRRVRDAYNKPPFTNEEVMQITLLGQLHGVNICWYLLDSKEDDLESRLETYHLICVCNPYRLRIWPLE